MDNQKKHLEHIGGKPSNDVKNELDALTGSAHESEDMP